MMVREAGPGADEGRRQEILDAALASFIEHGVAASSIRDIQRRSGASVGSIYHHFGGKDALAGAVYLQGLSDYQDGFLSVLARSAATRSGVEAAVGHHLGWVRRRPDLARFLLLSRDASVVVNTEAAASEQNRRFFAAVEAWTVPRIRARELRDLPVELMSAVWIGPSQEFARHWLAHPTQPSMVTAEAALPAAAWRALRGTAV